MRVNWKEVAKFVSGVAFAGSIGCFYLYANDVSLPFAWNISLPVIGRYFTPKMFFWRGAADLVVCVLLFRYGYRKRPE